MLFRGGGTYSLFEGPTPADARREFWSQMRRSAEARRINPEVDFYRFSDEPGTEALVFGPETHVRAFEATREPGSLLPVVAPGELAATVSALYRNFVAKSFQEASKVNPADLTTLRPGLEAVKVEKPDPAFGELTMVRDKTSGQILFMVAQVKGSPEAYHLIVPTGEPLRVLNDDHSVGETGALVITVTRPFEGHMRVLDVSPLDRSVPSRVADRLAAEREAWRKNFPLAFPKTPFDDDLAKAEERKQRDMDSLTSARKLDPDHFRYRPTREDFRNGDPYTLAMGVGLAAGATGGFATTLANSWIGEGPLMGSMLAGACLGAACVHSIFSIVDHVRNSAAKEAYVRERLTAFEASTREVKALEQKHREYNASLKRNGRLRQDFIDGPVVTRRQLYRPSRYEPVNKYWKEVEGELLAYEAHKLLSIFQRAERLGLNDNQTAELVRVMREAGTDYDSANTRADSYLRSLGLENQNPPLLIGDLGR